MSDRKYDFMLSVDEMMVLILALNCSDKPIEAVKQGETSRKLLQRLKNKIDTVYNITEKGVK